MKTEPNDASISAPKKPRFVPKIPPRKQAKTAMPKAEPVETKSDVIDKELLLKLNNAKSEDGFGRRMPRMDRKSAPVQVTFGQGSSSSLRSFGNLRGAVTGGKCEDGSDVPAPTLKEYVEPWDYHRTYYPVTLPLRRPYSGDPEILDKEEFGDGSEKIKEIGEDSEKKEEADNDSERKEDVGKDSKRKDQNKTAINPVMELGLMEASAEPQMLFFQFPAALPLAKQLTAAVDKGSDNMPDAAAAGSKGSGKRPDLVAVDGRGSRVDVAASGSKVSGSRPDAAAVDIKERVRQSDKKLNKGCNLKDLPAGFMGKMLVYKSGKIKMNIGDALFDVSPGVNILFALDVAVINAKEKHCCILGDPNKRAVVTPDIESLLDSIDKL